MRWSTEEKRVRVLTACAEHVSRLFFIVNQDLSDGSAHALYCFRNCWWLAKTDAACEVELIAPASGLKKDIFSHFGHAPLPNFVIKRLPALRKSKGKSGITVNLIYYWAAYRYLQSRLENGDWLISASFAKLFHFLLKRDALRQRARLAYEVHQLALLESGDDSARAKLETGVLAQMDGLITTSGPLHEVLQKHFPKIPVHNLGLACGFSPEQFPLPEHGTHTGLARRKEFTVAYIGSLYREQGVEWLIAEWPRIRKGLPAPARLEIAGGTKTEVQRLRRLVDVAAAGTVSLHGTIPPASLPAFLQLVDALIIPALAEGRMPYVAITKAYDYPGLNRPIVASNLPSIATILHDGQEALFFAPGQADDCIRALTCLMTKPRLASNLVAACRQLAAKMCWKARAERYWAILEGIT